MVKKIRIFRRGEGLAEVLGLLALFAMLTVGALHRFGDEAKAQQAQSKKSAAVLSSAATTPTTTHP